MHLLSRYTCALIFGTALMLIGAGRAAAQTTYDFYTGFSGTSNTASDTWQYFRDINVSSRTGTYTRFTFFDSSFLGNSGLGTWAAGDDNVNTAGLVGTNTSSNTYYGVAGGNGFLHPAHPGAGFNYAVAVGFRAPQTAVYDFSGNLALNQSSVSDGIRWYFDQGSTNRGSGTLTFGNSSTYSFTGVSMNAGEMAYFILDSGGTSGNSDSTQFNMTVSAIPEPSTYAAMAGVAMLTLAVWRRRSAPQKPAG